jgi:hypothetical protein
MPVRFAKPIAAAAVLLAMWGLDSVRGGRPTTWAGARAGHVRILQFYASTGLMLPGETAMLCYGVENAKTVHISPMLRGVYPSSNHCLQIVPEHTTHYTLMAEGYDGTLDARSLTLPVQPPPPTRAEPLDVALLVF